MPRGAPWDSGRLVPGRHKKVRSLIWLVLLVTFKLCPNMQLIAFSRLSTPPAGFLGAASQYLVVSECQHVEAGGEASSHLLGQGRQVERKLSLCALMGRWRGSCRSVESEALCSAGRQVESIVLGEALMGRWRGSCRSVR